jgi:hypothetical protein
MSRLHTFFRTATQQEKDKFSAQESFGYSRVDHKEGLRFLTGPRWWASKDFVPPEMLTDFQSYAFTLDKSMMRLMMALTTPLFGKKTPTEMARAADIPVAWGQHIGMLDTAYYFNNNPDVPSSPPAMGESIDDVNCVPHYDPGLLSLSVLSTCEGLQLQDPVTKEWHDAPTQSGWGVVWTGHAAVEVSEGKVPAGIHRVVYSKNKVPRLTMWYEVCTVKQCEPPAGSGDNVNEPQQQQKGIKVSNAPTAMMMMVPSTSSPAELLKKIERRTGLPPSKVMRIDDSFHSHF